MKKIFFGLLLSSIIISYATIKSEEIELDALTVDEGVDTIPPYLKTEKTIYLIKSTKTPTKLTIKTYSSKDNIRPKEKITIDQKEKILYAKFAEEQNTIIVTTLKKDNSISIKKIILNIKSMNFQPNTKFLIQSKQSNEHKIHAKINDLGEIELTNKWRDSGYG